MSPVHGITRRMREIGRIRMGDQVAYVDDKGREKKRAHRLDEFRLTSTSRALLEQAAAAFGGEVTPWPEAPVEGSWQLYTTSRSLPIAIPPSAEPYTIWYELWSGGGCQRRCDGETVTVSTEKGLQTTGCLCDPDPEERECKLTTRVNVMLPDIPVLGVWRLESHGYYAAVELPGILEIISSAAAQGLILPGELRIEQRRVKRPGQPPKEFPVPVIDLQVPMRDLVAGALRQQSLAMGGERPALEAGDETPARGAAPDTRALAAPADGSPAPSTAADEQLAASSDPDAPSPADQEEEPRIQALPQRRDNERRWTVASQTKPGTRYQVTRTWVGPAGQGRAIWACTCPDHRARVKNAGEHCKHAAAVIAELGEAFEEALGGGEPAETAA